MDVLAKLIDYMTSKFNTLKANNYYSLYLTTVGLFDCLCSVFTMKIQNKLLPILL